VAQVRRTLARSFRQRDAGIGPAESAFAVTAAGALGAPLGEQAARTLPYLPGYARTASGPGCVNPFAESSVN
jgi:hypothetical protein